MSTQFASQVPLHDRLRELYQTLIPSDEHNRFQRLSERMAEAQDTRSAALQAEDSAGSAWFLSNQTVGLRVSVDLFAGTLEQLTHKIPYFKELGIRLVHFTAQPPTQDLEMAQFRAPIAALRAEGIRVCLDVPITSTDAELEWSSLFETLAERVLFAANIGVSVVNLADISCLTTGSGTKNRNGPQVHTLLRMLRLMVEMVCPSVVLLGKGGGKPAETVKCFGSDTEPECHLLYNDELSVNLWNTLATRDARLMAKCAKHNVRLPKHACWLHYARCQDEIDWRLNDNVIQALGFNPEAHRQYLIHFYKGDHYLSHARGERFAFNSETLDACNCGTLASLAGLEASLEQNDLYQRELAIKRILLIHAQLLAEAGIPMLNSGDELAALNDWRYKEDPGKAADSRWLHRPVFDWERADNRTDPSTIEGLVFTTLQQLIAIRQQQEILGAAIPSKVIECQERPIYSFVKYLGSEIFLFIGNYSEDRQFVQSSAFHGMGLFGTHTDRISGKTVQLNQDRILLGPFEYLWLK